MLRRLTLIAALLLGLTACNGIPRGSHNEGATEPASDTSGLSCGNGFPELSKVSEDGVQIVEPTTECGVDVFVTNGEADCSGDFKLLQVDSPTSPVEIRRHKHYTEITWGAVTPKAIVINGKLWGNADNLGSPFKSTQLWDKHWGGAIDGSDVVKACV